MRPQRYNTATKTILSDRQQYVLKLIAQRYTNRQIAEDLDISLDGAKWNVSEILRKLELDTREEAAEYWRACNGLPARWRHALYGFLGNSVRWLGVASGALAAVVVIAIVIAGAPTSEPSAESTVDTGPPAPSKDVAIEPTVSGRSAGMLDTGKSLVYVLDAIRYRGDKTLVEYHLEGDLQGITLFPHDLDDPSAVPPLPIVGDRAAGIVTLSGAPGGTLRFPSAYRAVPSPLSVVLPLDGGSVTEVSTPHGVLKARLGATSGRRITIELSGSDVVATLKPGSTVGVSLTDDEGNNYPLVGGRAAYPAHKPEGALVRAYLAFSGNPPASATELRLHLPSYEALIVGDWSIKLP